jgi:hypothetical protein
MTAKMVSDMARQVYEREQSLRREVSDLHVRIDRERERQQVEEVVESEYFKQLQERVKQMRHAPGDGAPG